ncbi:MAG: PspC domain-containing protein [Anaerolineales bacterium]|nr:PspC domain-containing protein [Anaerolineales bacterium]MBS3752452.1 PspC domain-containing protein [Anaerolineales bacterium]
MSEANKKLYRSREDRMIAGVCGGLGEYFEVDPTLIRLLFVFGTFATGSGLLWVYLIMIIIIPEYVPPSEDVVKGQAVDVE